MYNDKRLKLQAVQEMKAVASRSDIEDEIKNLAKEFINKGIIDESP